MTLRIPPYDDLPGEAGLSRYGMATVRENRNK